VRITSTDPMEPDRLLAEYLGRDAADRPRPPRQ
jgi:hypothetical protein